MPKPSTPVSARSLAAIVFTDMVAYSALVQRGERLALELLELHFRMVRALLAGYSGREIKTIGDSFLIEFGSALDAVRFAGALQQRQSAHNAQAPAARRFELRIGIHIGDIEHRGKDIFGDGVNIASRLQALSPPGGVAVSRHVHDAVSSSLHAPFVSIGPQELKNIAAVVEVFVLAAPQLAALPSGPEPPAPASAGTRRRWPRLALAAIGAAVLLGAAVAWLARHPRGPTFAAVSDKSVAVLPLSSFGGNAEDQGFTDGLHDSILTHLAGIKDLRVISRTSVLEYRGTQRKIRDIGRELGVGAIVEGSVQRAGDRLRVNVQLIDAATDQHLWAADYNRDLGDVFALQAELATQIAEAVHANLSPEEKARIARKPTDNLEAYQLYLQALPARENPDLTQDSGLKAVGQLEQATRLDPKFALAYALIAELRFLMNVTDVDSSAEHFEQGRLAMETALALQPALAEAHLAKAVWLNRKADYVGALAELDLVEALQPGNALALVMRGENLSSLNHSEEGVAAERRAVQLDPRNMLVLGILQDSLQELNLFDEAIPIVERRLALAPDSFDLKLERAAMLASGKGELAPLKALLQEARPGFDPNCAVSLGRYQMAMLESRYAEAADQARACADPTWAVNSNPLPTSLNLGYALALDGKPEAAAKAYAQALERMQRQAAAHPEGKLIPALLFLGQALAGHQAEALALAPPALARAPYSLNIYGAAQVRWLLAEGYSQLGQADAALDLLEEIIRLPGGPTAWDLRHDEFLKPLLGLPRFNKLVADHTPPRSRLRNP